MGRRVLFWLDETGLEVVGRYTLPGLDEFETDRYAFPGLDKNKLEADRCALPGLDVKQFELNSCPPPVLYTW